MTTNQMIDAFEKRIKELLDKGYTPKQAVDMAYLEYPIMKTLQDEVKKSLHRIAEQGYGGVLAASVISKVFEMVWAPDKLTLSDRTTKGAKAVRDMVASVLHQQMLKNANYKANALALFDGYGYGGIIPEQDIPDFMRKLIKLSNGPNYDKQKYRNAMRQVERYIRQLNTQGMKYAYNKVLQAIESRNNEALFKAVHVATQERTRYFAERIARTERARAYIDGFLAKWQNNEDCVAYQWKLSTAHPDYDICDLYANADLYGLGKGIYPKDKVPTIPVHPHCMCRLKPIFKGQVTDEPSERIEQGGQEYINTLNQRQKEQLLGVKGSQLVEQGKAVWTEKARGYSRDVLKGRIDSGAISGALNNKNDPDGEKREKHAELYYETLRNSNRDLIIQKIAQNGNITIKSARIIFYHVFIDIQELEIGKIRFPADYYMAQSFQRLVSGIGIKAYDIIMLKHERLEYELMHRYGYPYLVAHRLTERKYNYSREIRNAISKKD